MSRLTTWVSRILTVLSLSCSTGPGQIPATAAGPVPHEKYGLGVAREIRNIRVSVDAAYSEDHQALILKAFQAWEEATSGILSFELTWNVPKPSPYKEQDSIPAKDHGIFLWSVPKTEEQGTSKQLQDWVSFWGLMVYGKGENSGNILVFEDVPPEKFYPVVLHEIGHLIGMQHESEWAWSVMDPHAYGECVTALDAKQVCGLYKCKAKPGCPDPHKVLPLPIISFDNDNFDLSNEPHEPQSYDPQMQVDQHLFDFISSDLEIFGLKLFHTDRRTVPCLTVQPDILETL